MSSYKKRDIKYRSNRKSFRYFKNNVPSKFNYKQNNDLDLKKMLALSSKIEKFDTKLKNCFSDLRKYYNFKKHFKTFNLTNFYAVTTVPKKESNPFFKVRKKLKISRNFINKKQNTARMWLKRTVFFKTKNYPKIIKRIEKLKNSYFFSQKPTNNIIKYLRYTRLATKRLVAKTQFSNFFFKQLKRQRIPINSLLFPRLGSRVPYLSYRFLKPLNYFNYSSYIVAPFLFMKIFAKSHKKTTKALKTPHTSSYNLYNYFHKLFILKIYPTVLRLQKSKIKVRNIKKKAKLLKRRTKLSNFFSTLFIKRVSKGVIIPKSFNKIHGFKKSIISPSGSNIFTNNVFINSIASRKASLVKSVSKKLMKKQLLLTTNNFLFNGINFTLDTEASLDSRFNILKRFKNRVRPWHRYLSEKHFRKNILNRKYIRSLFGKVTFPFSALRDLERDNPSMLKETIYMPFKPLLKSYKQLKPRFRTKLYYSLQNKIFSERRAFFENILKGHKKSVYWTQKVSPISGFRYRFMKVGTKRVTRSIIRPLVYPVKKYKLTKFVFRTIMNNRNKVWKKNWKFTKLNKKQYLVKKFVQRSLTYGHFRRQDSFRLLHNLRTVFLKNIYGFVNSKPLGLYNKLKTRLDVNSVSIFVNRFLWHMERSINILFTRSKYIPNIHTANHLARYGFLLVNNALVLNPYSQVNLFDIVRIGKRQLFLGLIITSNLFDVRIKRKSKVPHFLEVNKRILAVSAFRYPNVSDFINKKRNVVPFIDRAFYKSLPIVAALF